MNAIEEIKQRLDIVEFIGSYVPLQKAGRNYKALCPFHSEKTPSFVVFPDTQGWHCFGACATGGDIFTFAMRRENMDFAEALRFLADRAGIDLRPLGAEDLRAKDELDRLRAANAAAAQYYHRLLLERPEGETARAYLEKRGVTPETMRTFLLGYALDEWHALEEALRRQRLAPEDILAAGLTVKSDSGNIYDRFRGRLIFPIRDVQGQVIGFGGRVLDDGLPKYLNTPETPLFNKGSVLYGLDLARESIRSSGTAVIVEGYMDVVIPYQCGVTNLVACLGTALTEAHLQTLKRFTRRLILALDPDAAGMRAAERGADTARQALERRIVPVPLAGGLIRYEEQLNADIRILALPEGLDPDELILRDRVRWDRLVAEALPVVEYFLQVVLAEVDVASAKGKRAAADRLLPLIAFVDSPIERAHYLQRLAQRLHVDDRQLLPELDRLRSREGTGEPGRVGTGQRRAQTPALPRPEDGMPWGPEEHCLALLLQEPKLLPEAADVAGLSADVFQDVRNQQIFQALERYVAGDPEGQPSEFGVRLDSALTTHIESLLQTLRAGPPLSPEMVREDAIKGATRLRKSYLLRLIRELRFLQQDAQEEGAQERARELVGMIDQLSRGCLEVDRRAYAATLVGRKQMRDSVSKSTGA